MSRGDRELAALRRARRRHLTWTPSTYPSWPEVVGALVGLALGGVIVWKVANP